MKVSAQKKHVVLFSVACVIFVICLTLQLAGMIGLPLYLFDSVTELDPADAQVPGAAAFFQILIMITLPGVPLVVMEVMSVFWAIGLIPTGILKRQKNELPRKMQKAVENMYDVNKIMTVVGLGVFLINVVVVLFSKL